MYQYSKTNSDIISKNAGHQTMFGVDATTLQTYFGTTTHNDDGFDRIQFNFPHWRGKANNRYNRYVVVMCEIYQPESHFRCLCFNLI